MPVKKNRIKDSQADHLAKSLLLEESGNRQIVRIIILTISLIVIGFIAWSAAITLEEKAIAPGELVPASPTVRVQHPDGGLLSALMVKSGDHVEKGQLLFSLQPLPNESHLRETKAKIAFLLLEQERLLALINNRQPQFAGIEASPALIQSQRQLYISNRQALELNKQTLRLQKAQAESEYKALVSQQRMIEQQVRLTKEELAIWQKLTAEGLTSKIEQLRHTERLVVAEGELQQVTERVHGAMERYHEIESQLQEVEARSVADSTRQLVRTREDLDRAKEELRRHEDSVRMLHVRAEKTGTVHNVIPKSTGEVIPSEQTVMEIIPHGSELIAEVQISPRDIGHVRPGQTAQLRFTAYDFGRYGGVDGTITRISPSTVIPDDGSEPYYQAEIELQKQYIGSRPGDHQVMAGMVVEAGITTGEKTIFDYLIRPIHTSLSHALRER
ncbi:HlyD family type I secretion periplasmic adaptor subunit [Desulfurispira natronophila]|uniref:HlyD family type I secretion membrane fusion protein n=1 Tax=Desulfurispira natronophila TaxID=682562 RepID=A0A7W7Y5I9_9BACT|nr:HlyD family type I secretion periplasmic adaptor subunit [Desulfurispira natronophila]MBB5022495.1 HlyD family type I secretion membrane fusion protein [Desulfurispira natronophila]